MKSLSHLWKALLFAAVIALTVAGSASADVQSLSIDERATLSPGHQAIVVTGSITCTAGDMWAISARVIQGRRSGFGSLFSQTTCTGDPQDWSLPVRSDQGLFHRGRASAGISASWLGATFGSVQLDRFVTVH